MRKLILFCLTVLSLFQSGCIGQSMPSKKNLGSVELVIVPMVGNKPLYFDSLYTTPTGEKYAIRKLKFFISEIALARSIGEETDAVSEQFKNGVYLIDFAERNFDGGYGKQSYRMEFKMPNGEYSDLRFNIGLPRKINHLDPTSAAPPLDIAKGDMYWSWNSGYIFLLAEGKRPGPEPQFFHFAIGEDARAMPVYFGNLFNVTPMIKVSDKKSTRITLSLDFSKIFNNGDGSNYSIKDEESAIVHGGYQADALRNNFMKAFKVISVQ